MYPQCKDKCVYRSLNTLNIYATIFFLQRFKENSLVRTFTLFLKHTVTTFTPQYGQMVLGNTTLSSIFSLNRMPIFSLYDISGIRLCSNEVMMPNNHIPVVGFI